MNSEKEKENDTKKDKTKPKNTNKQMKNQKHSIFVISLV